MITCRSCGNTKPNDQFSIKNGKSTNLCRECKREADRMCYQRLHKKPCSLYGEPLNNGMFTRKRMELYAETIVARKSLIIRESYCKGVPLNKTLSYMGKYGENYLFQDKNGSKYSYSASQLWDLKSLNEKRKDE